MGWADKGLDCVISVVKPIFVPIAQVNAIMNYHDVEINDFDDKYFLKSVYDSEEEYNNALYEVYVIFGQGYGEAFTADGRPIAEHTYTGDYTGDGNINDYARWIPKKENKATL